MKSTWIAQRQQMVEQQISERGISDAQVLQAMLTVPREEFVPRRFRDLAYDDGPLRIGSGQTISQPYIVALMSEAAGPGPADRVLEIGTGSGYAAAVLSLLCRKVFTVERIETLATRARKRLQKLDYNNVEVLCGDGSVGLPGFAPFDAIIVTAGGPAIPQTLVDQLVVGGRLVMPVGKHESFQTLVKVTRTSEHYDIEDLGSVRFVPLIGDEGWPNSSTRAPRDPLHESGRSQSH